MPADGRDDETEPNRKARAEARQEVVSSRSRRAGQAGDEGGMVGEEVVGRRCGPVKRRKRARARKQHSLWDRDRPRAKATGGRTYEGPRGPPMMGIVAEKEELEQGGGGSGGTGGKRTQPIGRGRRRQNPTENDKAKRAVSPHVQQQTVTSGHPSTHKKKKDGTGWFGGLTGSLQVGRRSSSVRS